MRKALPGLHDLQGSAGLPTGPGALEGFFDRPFGGVRASVAGMLYASITDREVRRIPPGIGSIEQWVENVDVLAAPHRRVAAARAASRQPLRHAHRGIPATGGDTVLRPAL